MENCPNDRILFCRIASGDDRAFQQIFEHYRATVFSYLARVIKSREDAEELTQEVLFKIWTGRKGLIGIASPRHYVFVMARNIAIDYLRRAALDLRMRQRIWTAIKESANPIEEQVFANERAALIAEAIYRLSPQKQTIFKLSRMEGFTHDQIAVQLSISKNTIKNHIVDSIRLYRLVRSIRQRRYRRGIPEPQPHGERRERALQRCDLRRLPQSARRVAQFRFQALFVKDQC